MTSPLVFSMPVPVANLPAAGTSFHIAPDADAREALARALGLIALPALAADVTLTPEAGGGVRATGRLTATVRQECVVTLEAFDAPLEEAIDLRFVPEDKLPEARPGEEIEVGPEDIPDPLIDGMVDLGAVVTEFLTLGIDPYPRRPGAVFEPPAAGDPEALSPFGALARLRKSDPADEE